MQKLHFSVKINAERKKVWDTMLGKETFTKWTEVFMPGSRFTGSWNEGEKITFVAPEDDGSLSGMVGVIAENKPLESIRIRYMGIITNGKEDTASDSARTWKDAEERYNFNDTEGGTMLDVEIDTDEEYKHTFEELWPRALEKLKELAEA
jgi:L-rhamnose mutarotase